MPFVWFPLGLLRFFFVCFPLAGCRWFALVLFCLFSVGWVRLVCFGSFFSVCLVSAWFALVLFCLFSVAWVRLFCFGSVFLVFRLFGVRFFFACFPLVGCGWFALVLLFFVFRLFGFRLVCFGSCLFVFRWLDAVGLLWFHCVLFSVCLLSAWFALGLFFCLPLAGYGWFALVPLFLAFRLFGFRLVGFRYFLFVFRWLGAVGLLWFRCFCFSVCLVSAWFALVLFCLFSVGWVRLVCVGSIVYCFPFVWCPLGLLWVCFLSSVGWVRLVCFGSVVFCFPFVWFPLGLLWFFFVCFPFVGCGLLALVPLFLFSVCLVSAWFAFVLFCLFSVGWVRLVSFGSIVFCFPFVWFQLGLLFFFPLVGCGWFALVSFFLIFRLFAVRLVCFGSFLFVFRWLGAVGLLWFRCFDFPFVCCPLGLLWFFFVCFPLVGCGWFALVPLFCFLRLFGFRLVSQTFLRLRYTCSIPSNNLDSHFAASTFFFQASYVAYLICTCVGLRPPIVFFAESLEVLQTCGSLGQSMCWFTLRPSKFDKACKMTNIRSLGRHVGVNRQV